jgi:hypothetical protein
MIPPAIVLLMVLAAALPQTETPKLTIVSPKHPTDSRGETVYEYQGEDQKDQPVVSGVIVMPHPTKLVKPKYSKALKKERFAGDISLNGVITPRGDVIDLEGVASEDAEAIACATAAVEQYRFAPATLAGKPVAIRMRVVVNFKIR